MLFLFPKKKITLDAFTIRNEVLQYTPIKKASFYTPEWFKKLPGPNKLINKNKEVAPPLLSMKTCNGLTDYFSQGFVIPLWSDVNFEVNEEGVRYQFADCCSVCEFHSPKQYEGYIKDNTHEHIKMNPPWHLRCNSNINFLFSKVDWHFDELKEIYIPSGVLNFKHNSFPAINMFLPKSNSIISLKYGQPLIHLIPLTDKKVELKTHLVSQTEYDKVFNITRPCAFHSSLHKRTKLHDAQV